MRIVIGVISGLLMLAIIETAAGFKLAGYTFDPATIRIIMSVVWPLFFIFLYCGWKRAAKKPGD